MRLQTLTKDEVALTTNPNLNKLGGIDELVYNSQIRGELEIVFNPPIIVHKDVTRVFSSSPYNFAVTETNLGNNMVSLTKIDWR